MSTSFLGTYAGRSAFVTGHTGFKGSWLSLWLSELGARVTGYSLPPETDPSNFECSRVRRRLASHHEGDIRDRRSLLEALDAARPEVVFHLAARALVLDGYSAPHDMFDVNVLGTSCLLDCLRKLGRPCAVVVVTSDKCYENRGHVWGLRECDPMGGDDPYSASKGAAEIVAAAYRASFFDASRRGTCPIRLATARAGNCIGGGDWSRHRIIPDIVKALSEGRTVDIRHPSAVRPWQHLLEPLSGYLMLAERLLTPDGRRLDSAWNFGPVPGDELSVSDLADEFLRVWGTGAWRDASDPAPPPEAGVLRLAVEKAGVVLGWRPAWDAREAVRRTAAWYAQYANDPSGDMSAACVNDIAAYSAARAAT